MLTQLGNAASGKQSGFLNASILGRKKEALNVPAAGKDKVA